MFRLALKILIVYVLSTVAYYLWLILRYYRVFKFACAQNGGYIPLIPFVGNAYISILTGLRVNLLSTSLLAERFFGLPFSFWFGYIYNYVSNSAEDAKIVFNHSKCLNKAQAYDSIQYLFRNSILLIPAEQWKVRRRHLRSAYSTGMINQFIPNLYHQSCLLLERIKTKRAEDNHFRFFNTHAFMSFFCKYIFTFHSFVDNSQLLLEVTSIGWVEEDIQDSEVVEFAHLIDKVQDEFIKLLANPVVPVYLWIRTPLGAKLRLYNREMKRILKNILIKKKLQMDNLVEFVDKKNDLPLVELLLNDEYDARGESNVYEEFTFFAAAATDTTGHSLAFTFTLIGMHPEVQQKLYDEVTSVLGDKEIDSLDLPKLIYTEAVVSEAMRILPPVPHFGRYCSEDILLGDKVLPKGANIFISVFHIHRNPDFWEDPLKFDPDRFLPENLHKIVPGSYLPFSIGPRNCIGQRMAQVLIKITVANVVRNFRISSNHQSVKEFKLTSCISMKTRNHLDLHFEARKSS